MVVPNLLNIPKSVWFMFIIIFAILGSLIGVTTRIDTLQFQEIESLNDRLHELDKLVAVSKGEQVPAATDTGTTFVTKDNLDTVLAAAAAAQ